MMFNGVLIENPKTRKKERKKGKTYYHELRSARDLMKIYIARKVHENVLKGFPSYTVNRMLWLNMLLTTLKMRNFKMYKDELWFLRFACHLMMIYICIKFHKKVLNGFKL